MAWAIQCPVCGKSTLVEDGDVCPNCRWFRDTYQEEFPDETCGENQMSLNEARAAWAEGKKVDWMYGG